MVVEDTCTILCKIASTCCCWIRLLWVWKNAVCVFSCWFRYSASSRRLRKERVRSFLICVFLSRPRLYRKNTFSTWNACRHSCWSALPFVVLHRKYIPLHYGWELGRWGHSGFLGLFSRQKYQFDSGKTSRSVLTPPFHSLRSPPARVLWRRETILFVIIAFPKPTISLAQFCTSAVVLRRVYFMIELCLLICVQSIAFLDGRFHIWHVTHVTYWRALI